MGKRKQEKTTNQPEIIPELQPLVGARQSDESDSAVLACNDWLRMGPSRSVASLFEKYKEIQVNSEKIPALGSLYAWSSRYSWAERARIFDAEWEQRKNAERQAEMEYGLALDYERVRRLKRLADFLEAQIFERSTPDTLTGRESFYNIWVPDVKVVGKGDTAEVIDIERFNAPLITEYRNTLNDLAKEVGGRVQKAELTGADGGPIQHEHRLDSEQYDRALTTLADAFRDVVSITASQGSSAVDAPE